MERKQDFTKKIVIVLDKSLEPWQALNAVAHISAYIGHNLDSEFGTGEYFITRDHVKHPRNAQFAIILLRAKPAQLQTLMAKVRDSGLLFHGFIKEMIETTDDSEITGILSQKSDVDIEYLGVGIFGDNDMVHTLTKSYQTWR